MPELEQRSATRAAGSGRDPVVVLLVTLAVLLSAGGAVLALSAVPPFSAGVSMAVMQASLIGGEAALTAGLLAVGLALAVVGARPGGDRARIVGWLLGPLAFALAVLLGVGMGLLVAVTGQSSAPGPLVVALAGFAQLLLAPLVLGALILLAVAVAGRMHRSRPRRPVLAVSLLVVGVALIALALLRATIWSAGPTGAADPARELLDRGLVSVALVVGVVLVGIVPVALAAGRPIAARMLLVGTALSAAALLALGVVGVLWWETVAVTPPPGLLRAFDGLVQLLLPAVLAGLLVLVSVPALARLIAPPAAVGGVAP